MWNIHVKMKYGSETKRLVLANVINHDDMRMMMMEVSLMPMDKKTNCGTDAIVDDSQDIKLP